jgi:iron complex transport system ATP-binding protein
MEPRLSLRGATFCYDDRAIFCDLDLDVYPGEVLSILGPNGCGKTTLLRCISGALKLKVGNARLNGTDISSLSVTELARKIGFLYQEHHAPFPFSVLEVVRMGRTPYLGIFDSPSAKDIALAELALTQVGMLHLEHKPYTQISGGERQLVLLARTLAQEPEIILLDEPTSHLDFGNQALSLQLITALAKQGISMIMTTHNPNHALLFPDRAALMNGGSLMAVGSADEVITEDNLKATYGIDVKVFSVRDPSGGGTLKLCSPWLDAASARSAQSLR